MRTHELVKQELLARLGSQWQVDQWLPPVSELAKILSAGHVSTHRALQSLAEEGYLLPLRGKGTKILRAKATSKATSTAAQTIPLGVRPKVAILRTRHTDAMVHRMVDAFIDAAKPMNPDYVFAWQEGKGESPVLNETADVAVLFNPILGDDLKTIWPRVNHVSVCPFPTSFSHIKRYITLNHKLGYYICTPVSRRKSNDTSHCEFSQSASSRPYLPGGGNWFYRSAGHRSDRRLGRLHLRGSGTQRLKP